MNYFTQKKNLILFWWIALLAVLVALAFGYFFLSLYTAIPIVFFRCLLPYPRQRKSRFIGIIQYLAVVSFLTYLGATGTITHVLDALWSRQFTWLLLTSVILTYIGFITQEYRYLSNLSQDDVTQFYKKRIGQTRDRD